MSSVKYLYSTFDPFQPPHPPFSHPLAGHAQATLAEGESAILESKSLKNRETLPC
jgi:hypothetical protein